MSYTVTPEDMASISDVEMAFGAERLLPAWEDIPLEFQAGNRYTELAEAIFFGRDLPDCEIEMKNGFDPQSLNRAVRAHLQSYGPKHQHKIAGVGLMISHVATLI